MYITVIFTFTVIRIYNKSDTNISNQIRDAAYTNDRMLRISTLQQLRYIHVDAAILNTPSMTFRIR